MSIESMSIESMSINCDVLIELSNTHKTATILYKQPNTLIRHWLLQINFIPGDTPRDEDYRITMAKWDAIPTWVADLLNVPINESGEIKASNKYLCELNDLSDPTISQDDTRIIKHGDDHYVIVNNATVCILTSSGIVINAGLTYRGKPLVDLWEEMQDMEDEIRED